MRNCIRPDARSIPMVVPYAGGILSGQGLLVGAFFGVAAADAAQNATVECETRGEFELTKEPALAISQGARVFWDNTNRRITTTATGNFQVGLCTVAALAADATVRVMLERVPASGA
jgi:predicted RecA/RadA family phage recombinase